MFWEVSLRRFRRRSASRGEVLGVLEHFALSEFTSGRKVLLLSFALALFASWFSGIYRFWGSVTIGWTSQLKL